MEHYAGLDVSLELTSVCMVDAQGRIVCETKVTSEPEALVRFLATLEHPMTRVGLEAGPLSEWIYPVSFRSLQNRSLILRQTYLRTVPTSGMGGKRTLTDLRSRCA